MKQIFNPKSIALIGASEEKNSVGLGLAKNILESNKNIFFVNPFKDSVLGLKCYDKVTDIKSKIDLVVIAVPAKIVKETVIDCASKKVGAVIIISGGFKEEGKEKEEEEIKKILKESNIPLIGPNCLGIISNDVNASFAPIKPKKGSIAFLSQSGAIINSIIDKAGFSKIVSYGNEADLGLVDFLQYLDNDKETKVISIYIEGLKDGRKFMEVAKKISKPIVLIKAGRSKKGKKAVGTHTGSLAGDYEVYKAAMKQSGVILVDTIEELLDISKALSFLPKCKNGIGIITNGGGLGILTTDYCFQYGVEIPELKKETISFLDKELKGVKNKNNPLDIIGDALPERYRVAMEGLLNQKDINGLIVISASQTMTDHKENAKIVVEMRKKYPQKPIVCYFKEGKLEENNVPNYPDAMRAVKSIRSLIKNEQ